MLALAARTLDKSPRSSRFRSQMLRFARSRGSITEMSKGDGLWRRSSTCRGCRNEMPETSFQRQFGSGLAANEVENLAQRRTTLFQVPAFREDGNIPVMKLNEQVHKSRVRLQCLSGFVAAETNALGSKARWNPSGHLVPYLHFVRHSLTEAWDLQERLRDSSEFF